MTAQRDLILRPAQEQDAFDLYQACWCDRPFMAVQDFLQRCLAAMQRGRGFALVAEAQGQVVGFGMLTLWGQMGEISDLVVSPSRRGGGIGTALIEYLSEKAARLGIPAVEIGVSESNPRARALYERLGFSPHRTLELNLETITYLALRLRGDE